jgi:hypothetical protein
MVRNMMRMLFAIVALFAVSSTASAQRWGHEDTPRAGVCFYENANYRGEYFCIRPGEGVSTMPGDMNDRISSIRIFGEADVTVFRDVDFRGSSRRFDTSIRNLVDEGWNDRISSLRVRAPGFDRFDDRNSRGDRGRDDRGARDDRRPREDPDVIIRRAYQDILQRDPDQGGLRSYRVHIIDDGWTEEQIRAALRNSQEYRDLTTMTRPKAAEIVRRAYLAVLKREPDPAGAEGFINAVMKNKWSQADVENELRKSPEYRNRK